MREWHRVRPFALLLTCVPSPPHRARIPLYAQASYRSREVITNGRKT